MREKTIGKLANALYGYGFTLRGKRRAARRLAEDGSPGAARVLMMTLLFAERGRRVEDIARRGLASLRSQESIDAACETWNEGLLSRSPRQEVDRFVREQRWVASGGPYLRARTALHAGRPEVLLDGGAAIAEALLRIAADDRIKELRARARRAVRRLRDPDAREAICAAAVEGGDERALRIVLRAGFEPRDAVRRATLLFLTGRYDAYAELDYDGSLLAAAHTVADAGLRRRLIEAARTSGRLDWVRAVVTDRPDDRLAGLSDEEWETLRALLVRAHQWERLWRLALAAPPVRSVALLRDLAKSRWRPDDERDRARFGELIALAARCRRRPPETRLEAPPEFAPTSLAVSADGRLLAAGAGRQIRLWRLPSGKRHTVIDWPTAEVKNLAISPDESLLVGGLESRDGRDNGRRYLGSWRLPDGEWVRELYVRTVRPEFSWSRDVVLSPDATTFAFVPIGEIKVARVDSGELIATFDVDTPEHPVAISPDGSMLTNTNYTGDLFLWRLPSGEQIARLRDAKSYHMPLTFVPDGDSWGVAWRYDGVESHVRLWRPSSGAVDRIQEEGSSCTALTATADGRYLVSGHADGSVRLWRLPSAELAAVLHAHAGAVTALTSDATGRLVASAAGDGVRWWCPAVLAAAQRPAGRISLSDVDDLRAAPRSPWIEFVSELVRWRHRRDIEAGDPAAAPGPADIEVDREPLRGRQRGGARG